MTKEQPWLKISEQHMLSFNLAEYSTDNLDKSKAETNNTITLRTMNKSQDQYILTIDNLTNDNADSNNKVVNQHKVKRECNVKLSDDLNIDFEKVDNSMDKVKGYENKRYKENEMK